MLKPDTLEPMSTFDDLPKSPKEIAARELFEGDHDWWHNACLNWNLKWAMYATGYLPGTGKTPCCTRRA